MRARASVRASVHECATADVLERSYSSLGKRLSSTAAQPKWWCQKTKPLTRILLCIFPPSEGEAERPCYGLAAATTTESANTEMVGMENSVAHPSIIKCNKTSPLIHTQKAFR